MGQSECDVSVSLELDHGCVSSVRSVWSSMPILRPCRILHTGCAMRRTVFEAQTLSSKEVFGGKRGIRE